VRATKRRRTRARPAADPAQALDRIIAEYAADAIAELAAPAASFTADDHVWIRNHAAASLAEIEAATLRLVALYTSRNLSHAAARLGMAPVSLSRWLGRRELPR
jgi:ActR/RegA family two-component response regulator